MATPQETTDRVGGWLSLACAIHCAVVPVLVLLAGLGAPIAGDLALFHDARVEIGFSIAAVVFVAVNIALSWRDASGRRTMFMGFGIGLALILGSRVTPGPDWLAHVVIATGALIVALTHRQSLRSQRNPDCCSEPASPASAPLLP